MKHITIHLTLCVVLLLLAACGSALSPTPQSTLPPPTSTLPPPKNTAPPPTAIPPAVIAEIDAYLDNLTEQSLFSGSVLIAHQGNILFSQGYGLADRDQNVPNTPQTRFRLASITKQFTAMAILILQEQGKLNVQDHICTYFSDCPAVWQTITIHHLLTHTSGIPNLYSDYARATALPPEQTIARFQALPLDYQPGEDGEYRDSGYILLGYIIEQASGLSYEEFLQETIFTPLALKDTGYDHLQNDLAVGYQNRFGSTADLDNTAVMYGAGALYSTVEDLYQWEQALSTGQLVSQASLNEIFTPHAAGVIPFDSEWAYGYGWLIGTERGRPIIWHGGRTGGFTGIIIRYPDHHLTVIALSNVQSSAVIGPIQETLSMLIFGDE